MSGVLTPRGGSAARRPGPSAAPSRRLATTTPRPTTAPRSLTAFLAALPIALVPMTVSVPVSFDGKTFQLTGVQVAVAVLAAHLLMSALATRSWARPLPGRPLRTVALILLCTAPAVIVAPDLVAALGGYVNFAFGVAGGAMVGVVWRRVEPGRRGWIEDGLITFLVVGALQLLRKLTGSHATSAFHESAQTSWGGSNYVALTLVVAALALVGHGRAAGTLRWVDVVAAGLGLVGAGLTYSRGGIVAAGVGLVVLCWSWPRPGWRRVGVRGLTMLAPLGVMWLLDRVVALRAMENEQVYRNIDLRMALYQLAFDEFRSHPLLGTGWLGLRPAAEAAFGHESAFAHNLVLSFLQIGGLLGLVPVAFILLRSRTALRCTGMAAPVLAALAGSFSDPLFEGTVAALLAWTAIWYAQGWTGRGAATPDHAAGPDRAAPDQPAPRQVARTTARTSTMNRSASRRRGHGSRAGLVTQTPDAAAGARTGVTGRTLT